MVVISDVPMLSIGVTHERVAFPSTCTVQAPHSAMPQPNFVPVMPSTSRNTQRSGVSPSTSTVCICPLTLRVEVMTSFRSAGGHQGQSTAELTALPESVHITWPTVVVDQLSVAISVIAWANSCGASWGRLCPTPPLMSRCSYLPENF